MRLWWVCSMTCAAVVFACEPLAAQSTIATNATGPNDSTASFTFGQSFTTASTATAFNRVTISFQNSSGQNVGSVDNKVYLFSQPYTGSPSGLAAATSLGSATSNGSGGYSFSPSLTLASGTKYFAYNNSPFSVGASGSNPYASGELYAASSAGTFDELQGIDARFIVVASAVPEPATWSLMIIGFGIVGSAARRKKRSVANLAHA